MKRILILLLAAAMAATSCKGQLEFVYRADITGDADGHVLVSFPDGRLNINGDANLAFSYANDSLKTRQHFYTPEQINLSTDKKRGEILQCAKPYMDAFNVTSAGGNYDIYIKGYVTEKKTGITFNIDKRFTNREDKQK